MADARMMPMIQTLGAFRAALVTGWIALSAAGFLYARERNIPMWAAVPIVAAFLLEYSFYLVPGFETIRLRLRTRFTPAQLAFLTAGSGVLPYLVYSIATGQFRWLSFVALAGITAILCFWYVMLKASPLLDLLFLAFVAAMVLLRVFDDIYSSPVRVRIDILGKLMLVHCGALVMLELRRVHRVRFGFLPSQKEWITGVRYFFYFLPVGLPLVIGLGLGHLAYPTIPFWQTLAIFFGILWVVALGEEFFFRGLLQNWLAEWTGNRYLALAAVSLLFGAAHLWFRGFPNWKLAIVAAVAGCFYGLAYHKAASIRASMVAHALVVALWRTVFVFV